MYVDKPLSGIKAVQTLSRLNRSSHFHDLEMQVRALPLKEKAALARLLIGKLDISVDADAEQLWIDEAQRRYDAYQRGEIEARPSVPNECLTGIPIKLRRRLFSLKSTLESS